MEKTNHREVFSMYDELTEVDVRKMREEIDYRIQVLRPKLIQDVQTARAFGDLSENFEYKCAKQEKNRNESRIRYLQRMVSTAKVIPVADSGEDTVGLFDKVAVFHEKLGREMTLCIVTTLRADAGKGLISKESPVGKALLGRKTGERVRVKAGEVQYDMVVRSIEKGEDDESLEIRRY